MTKDEKRRLTEAMDITAKTLQKLYEEEAINKQTALHRVLNAIVYEMRVRDRIAQNERKAILDKLNSLDTSG